MEKDKIGKIARFLVISYFPLKVFHKKTDAFVGKEKKT